MTSWLLPAFPCRTVPPSGSLPGDPSAWPITDILYQAVGSSSLSLRRTCLASPARSPLARHAGHRPLRHDLRMEILIARDPTLDTVPLYVSLLTGDASRRRPALTTPSGCRSTYVDIVPYLPYIFTPSRSASRGSRRRSLATRPVVSPQLGSVEEQP